MPVVQIDGVGRVQLDDSFLTLSPADQQKTVDEIAHTHAASTASTVADGPKDTSFSGAVAQAFNNVGAPLADTADLTVGKGVGDAIRGVTPEAPKNYDPATPKFLKSGTDAPWYDFDWSQAPRAIVEQGAQIGASLLARGAGAGIGGAVAGPPGAAAGALAGPTVLGAMETVGPILKERMKAEGRTEPTAEDWTFAWGAAAANGGLDALGIKGIGKAGSGIAANAVKMASTQGAQQLVQQGASTADTPDGLQLDPKAAAGQAILGTVAGAVPDVAMRGARTAISPMPEADPSGATQRLAERIQQKANDTGANLDNIAYGAPRSAEATLESVHNDIAEQVKGLRGALSEQLDPARAQNFADLMDRMDLAGTLRDARNKRKGLLGEADFQQLDQAVGHLAEGRQLVDTVRQAQQLQEMFRRGMKGGVSRITDAFAPLGVASGQPLSATFGDRVLHLGKTAAGYAISPTLTAAQLAIYGGGHAIDAVTGRRSRVAHFIAQQARLGQAPTLDTSGVPSVLGQRVAAQQASAAQATRNQILGVFQQQQALRAQQAHRAQLFLNDHPGTGGFDFENYQATGVRPQEFYRGVDLLHQQGRITDAEHNAFNTNPADLMANNRGNHIRDYIAQLADAGTLTRDPAFRPGGVAPVPASSVNPMRVAAYRAQANGNQARVSQAHAAVLASALPAQAQGIITNAITRIGARNNRMTAFQAQRAMVATLHSAGLGAHEQAALAITQPLVSQIRHASPGAAANGAGARP